MGSQETLVLQDVRLPLRFSLAATVTTLALPFSEQFHLAQLSSPLRLKLVSQRVSLSAHEFFGNLDVVLVTGVHGTIASFGLVVISNLVSLGDSEKACSTRSRSRKAIPSSYPSMHPVP
jgi:hypothetical protein